jgi:uncharacterized protein
MRAPDFRFGLALAVGLGALAAVSGAHAQQRPPTARVVVSGEGSVSVAPDVAQIRSGVTTRGKTVREATEANSKIMAAILNALTESGIPQKDVRTAQFSIQPVYAAQEPGKEQRLVGYSVGNHVGARIKHIEKLGDVLDRLIAAGATDVWNVELLVSDPAKPLDQAREPRLPTRGARRRSTRKPPGSRSDGFFRSRKLALPHPARCARWRTAPRLRSRSPRAKARSARP